MTLRATILGVSVWGPGLDGWEAARPILAGTAPYVVRPLAPPPPPLPPAERRRCGPVVRLALAAAHEAAAALPAVALRAVFASSTGDGPIVGAILDALAIAGDERVVSPTQFHNSVHNAPAGYWSIATGSRAPATCLGAHDDTFAAALLTAMAEHAATQAPVLLCCYDHPLPPPLDAVRPIGAGFAVAMVLGQGAGVSIDLAYAPDRGITGPWCEAWTDLARNPAARALPLLRALARAEPARLAWPYLDGTISLNLVP